MEKHYDALNAFFMDNESVARTLCVEFLGKRELVEEYEASPAQGIDHQHMWSDMKHLLTQHPEQIGVLCQYLPPDLSEKVLSGKLVYTIIQL